MDGAWVYSGTGAEPPIVFLSYSHKDEVWKNRFRPHLGMLGRLSHITVWDDREIDPRKEWFDKIKAIMDRAAVSICLISPDYLDSNFCIKEEILYLLELRRDRGMEIVPILVRQCFWEAVPWLEKLQMLPRDNKSVADDFPTAYDPVFKEVARTVYKIVTNPNFRPPPPPLPRFAPPEKVDIDRLPQRPARSCSGGVRSCGGSTRRGTATPPTSSA